MSDYGLSANLESFEGNVSGEETLTFTRRSNKIVITNDHATNNLLYKFHDAEEFGTLKGTESLSIYFWTRTIIINGNGPYRIWSFR